jgi:hypothetical protein
MYTLLFGSLTIESSLLPAAKADSGIALPMSAHTIAALRNYFFISISSYFSFLLNNCLMLFAFIF